MPTTSLMIKSVKGVEKRRKGINAVGVAYLSLGRGGGGGGGGGGEGYI